MTATEREKCAEILARHLGVPVDTITKELWLNARSQVIDALLEARALARREALLEASALCFKRAGGMPCTAMELGTAIRSLIQPSPDTEQIGDDEAPPVIEAAARAKLGE